MPKQKYYVVWNGKNPGVYNSWSDCKKQIEGISGAKYKSFETVEAANDAFKNKPENYLTYKESNINSLEKSNKINITPIIPSISVDAACAGNPGIMEYRGVFTHSKEEIFRQGPYKDGTNNIGEFLAIVHALAWLDKNKINMPIYTDSVTALSWVKKRKANTKLEMNINNSKLFELLVRAENWLQSHTWDTKVLKWDTENWGEIPADFGRK